MVAQYGELVGDVHGKGTMKRSEYMPEITDTADESSIATTKVHACVQERLCNCPHAFCFNKVAWHYEGGILTLQGHVATFYLKQILQTMLRGVSDVQQIANEVEVVSATGLSSVRKR